jgi:hypothetical protein
MNNPGEDSLHARNPSANANSTYIFIRLEYRQYLRRKEERSYHRLQTTALIKDLPISTTIYLFELDISRNLIFHTLIQGQFIYRLLQTLTNETFCIFAIV